MAALIFSTLLLSNAWGDLTGRWTCNDGVTYYLRQNSRQIRWYGESADVQPAWSNVFSGHTQEDRIQGSWTDVPKGQSAMLAKGGSPSGAMAEEDCIAFDPMAATVSKVQGSWKIAAGRRWLFDFAQNETGARQALAVIRKKGFSQSCFVGRSDAGFTYLRR